MRLMVFFDLPWGDKSLQVALLSKMERTVMEDDTLRRELEVNASVLSKNIAAMGFQLLSDYSFSVEWDLKRYLKSFGFSVDVNASVSLLDKLILFLMCVQGMPLLFLV